MAISYCTPSYLSWVTFPLRCWCPCTSQIDHIPSSTLISGFVSCPRVLGPSCPSTLSIWAQPSGSPLLESLLSSLLSPSHQDLNASNLLPDSHRNHLISFLLPSPNLWREPSPVVPYSLLRIHSPSPLPSPRPPAARYLRLSPPPLHDCALVKFPSPSQV